MAKKCTYLYYDADGNPSALYEKEKQLHGEAAAHAKFIMNAISTDPIIRSSLGDDGDTKLRKDHSKAAGYVSNSAVINRSISDTKKDKIIASMALGIAINQEARDNNIDFATAKENIHKYFGYNYNDGITQNKDEFILLKKDAEALFKAQTDKANLVHKLFETIFKIKNESQINRPMDAVIEEAIAHLQSNEKITLSVKNAISELASDLNKRLIELNKINKANGIDEDWEIMVENTIVSDKMKCKIEVDSNGRKYKDSPIKSRLDLMFYSKSAKRANLIDFKLKSGDSVNNYSNLHDNMDYPFGHLRYSAENMAALQLSLSAETLRLDYDIKVDDNGLEVLLIAGNFVSDEKTNGKREWRLDSIDRSKTEFKSATFIPGAFHEILDISNDDTTVGSTSGLISDIFDDKLELTASSKQAYLNKKEAEITTKDGKFSWFNTMNRGASIYNADTKEDVMKHISKVYDDFIESKKNIAADLVDKFNGNKFPATSVWNSKIGQQQAFNILAPYSKETHTMETHKHIKGLDKDIIVVTNNITGETHLISLAHMYNTEYTFNDENDKNDPGRSTIFGTLMKDDAVNKKYGKGVIPKASTSSLNHLRLAALAVELKEKFPQKYKIITKIDSNTLLSEKAYSTTTLTEQLGYLGQIASMMEENKDPNAAKMRAIVASLNIKAEKADSINFFQEFITNITSYSDPLYLLTEKDIAARKDAKYIIDKIKEANEKIMQNKHDLVAHQDLEKKMEQYVQKVYAILLTEHTTRVDNIYNDARFVAANRAWLDYKGWLTLENPTYQKNIFGSTHSLTSTGDEHAKNLHLAITEAEQKARDEINELMGEHARLQTALIKKTLGINFVNKSITQDAYKALFKDMLVDGFEFKSDNVENWMVFKDPDSAGLTKEQSDYIRFYAKMVEKCSRVLFPNNYKLMYPSGEATDFAKGKWSKYSIPIIRGDETAEIDEVSLSTLGSNSFFKSIKGLFTRGKRAQYNASNNIAPWELQSVFPEQVDGDTGRGSSGTRSILNITNTNTVIENKRQVQMNPILVLNTMLQESARKSHMQTAAFASFAIQADLAYKDLFPTEDTQELRGIMHNIAIGRIHGKVKEEGKGAATLDMVKHVVQFLKFWGSFSQFTTEAGTATVQITSQTAANWFNKYILKGTNKYDNSDLAWAAKKFGSKLGSQILGDFGFFNSSLSQFSEDDYNMLKGASITEYGRWAVQNTLEQAVQVNILAQMHKEGVTDKCFVLDKDTNKFKYDETKDDRFYVYTDDNSIPGQKKDPPKGDDIKKYKLWQAHLNTLAKEGGLTVEGRMKRPFTNAQLQGIKGFSIRLLGAMDNTEMVAAEAGALGRAMLTFQRYMKIKVTNLIGISGDGKNFNEGKWKYDDETGEYAWIEERFEGMLQAFVGIGVDLFNGKNMQDISDVRKRQASKLLSDLLLYLILFILASSFKDVLDEKKQNTVIKKEFEKGLLNAASDLNMLASAYRSVDGSPFPGISVAASTVKTMGQSITHLVIGDVGGAKYFADKSLEMAGSYRTGKAFMDIFMDSAMLSAEKPKQSE